MNEVKDRHLFKSFKDFVGSNVWLSKHKVTHVNGQGMLVDYYADLESQPWADASPCPATVLKEYPTYILVEILPHLNPHRFGVTDSIAAMSQSYKVTIHKHDIQSGRVRIRRI